MNKRQPDQGNVTRRHLEMLRADDEFLSALARGEDPSNGGDELAHLLLLARQDVMSDLPPAPTLRELGFAGFSEAVTGELPVVDAVEARSSRGGYFASRETEYAAAGEHPVAEAEKSNVVELRPRRSRAFLHGLVGAAAATLVIAGSGVVIHNAEPGSPLYSLNQQIFGGHDVEVVQLASTLQEANELKARGDIEGAKQKLAEAQALVNRMKPQGREKGQSLVNKASANIVTPEPEQKPLPVPTTTVAPPRDLPTTTETPAESSSKTPSTTQEVPVAESPEPSPEAPAEETAPRTPSPVEETSQEKPAEDKGPSIPQAINDVVQGISPEAAG
ncbi:hypothetical protein [Corynebacterium gerontici]|uniref:Anti-sigma-D factor RsdA n=1 Tax=Corynebacterium gerontici TaxID=2079234 RepID=A0A3G6J1Y4_9CORY|nr:hypothetical protein [Corynebacterium gerontici]AZA12027.1 hypothetical protein CGERO_08680 [Corynebacterium gerontici]